MSSSGGDGVSSWWVIVFLIGLFFAIQNDRRRIAKLERAIAPVTSEVR